MSLLFFFNFCRERFSLAAIFRFSSPFSSPRYKSRLQRGRSLTTSPRLSMSIFIAFSPFFSDLLEVKMSSPSYLLVPRTERPWGDAEVSSLGRSYGQSLMRDERLFIPVAISPYRRTFGIISSFIRCTYPSYQSRCYWRRAYKLGNWRRVKTKALATW